MSSSTPIPSSVRSSGVRALSGPGHNPVLDGVRGLAILLVMVHHFTVFNAGSAFEEWLHYMLGLGATGVTLFFVLSGFLITGILYDSKASAAPNYFRNFYARRTVRIFPLYYAVTFLALVVIPYVIPALVPRVASPQAAATIQEKLNRFGSVQGYEWWFWLYLCNVPMAELCKFMHGILGVCWSLAIEEQFYLAWPLAVFVFSRKNLVRFCWVMIAGALVSRVVLVAIFNLKGGDIHNPPAFANPIGAYVLTFCRIDGLAAGALLALAARAGVGGGWAVSGTGLARWIRLAKMVVLVGVPLMLAIPVGEKLLGLDYPEMGLGFGFIDQTIGYSAAVLVYTAAIFLALQTRPGTIWRWIWTNRFMLVLGKFSYAIYLFHVPLRALVRDLVYGPAGKPARWHFHTLAGSELPGQLLFMLGCTVISIAAAWLSWHVFEKHCLKLKKYFPSGAERREAR